MRNLKLAVAYDGTAYRGWQFQPNAPTIQGELNRAIGLILNHAVTTHGSGRTDAGVHAHRQIVNFHTNRTLELGRLHRSLNAVLPTDIRIDSIEEVAADFHARLSARAKTYHYHVWRSPVVPPFRVRYVAAVWRDLDTEAIDRATRQFVGSHDFTSFSAASTTPRNRVRRVDSAEWVRTPVEWVFQIRASGFLQHMARAIVGTLIEVGRRRIRPEDIAVILESRDRQCAGPTAPAKGLHLISVDY